MATKVERLLPSLEPYPPSDYVVVHHPDVQLTPEEWIELTHYEKVESDALADPGVVGFMAKPGVVKIPLHAAMPVHNGRNQGA